MKFSYAWVTLLKCGKSPFAPGTVGSLAAVTLWPIFILLPVKLMLGLWCILFAVSWYCTQEILREETDSDPSWIVIDEALAVWLIPIAFKGQFSLAWLWVWLLFRLIDIMKPWPVSAIERMKPDVFAVIFDDIAAVLIAILLVKFWLIAS